MSLDFTGSTSRRALILGMTNTDQIAMWQARAPQAAATIPDHAERLNDAGDGADTGGDAGDVNEATGLNAEEQAEFDRMAQGGDPEPPAAGDDQPSDDDGEGDDGDGDDANIDPPAPAPPVVGEKTAAELAAQTPPGQRTAPKTVSFGKYQRELKRSEDARIAAEGVANKAREDAIKLAERVAIINEALSAPQPPPAVDPNAPPANPFDEEDIDPNVDYAESVKQIQRRQRFQVEQTNRVEQDFTESREDTEMRSTFTRDFNAFSSTEQGKDLPAAYQFLKDSRLTEICISQFDKDPNDPNEVFAPAEVAKMVEIFNNEEKWVVGTAISAGKSPAAAIMKLARARGFKAAPIAAAAPPVEPSAPTAPRVPAMRNGAGQPPAGPSATQQLADLAAARESGRSLSDGGGAPPQGLTAQMLLAMDDDEFSDMVDQLTPHQLNSLMGKGPG